ncbi:CAAX amino terminal protease [Pelistega indica]|uniref:CAAX amino terminal protease n=1 Tax=Pelistega indica TaxID=1414851 RepID=V8G980_9BURK|nr:MULTISPECIES: CPBP family glutamic-type intramembrane protease [Pelistega]ETD72272.1 CAAX amino terminal protease [Pelistega indica]
MRTFKQDLLEYWQYMKKPTLNVRIEGRRGSGWWSDLKIHTPFTLLFKWLIFLWGMNVFVLAPIAMGVSGSLGANHKLHSLYVPILFFMAAIWAPLVEELLFRYSLRRPKLIILYVGAMIYVFSNGIRVMSLAVVMVLLALFLLFDLFNLTTEKQALPYRWRKVYIKIFPFVFHISVFIFASMHLWNYELTPGSAQKEWYLLPFLILPQWLTGSVLAWMRVRDSFVTPVVMHAMFNGVPALLLAILWWINPSIMASVL